MWWSKNKYFPVVKYEYKVEQIEILNRYLIHYVPYNIYTLYTLYI